MEENEKIRYILGIYLVTTDMPASGGSEPCFWFEICQPKSNSARHAKLHPLYVHNCNIAMQFECADTALHAIDVMASSSTFTWLLY